MKKGTRGDEGAGAAGGGGGAVREKRPHQGDGPKFLTAKEVAARYHQPISWVYGCLTLPRRKIGKYLVFREDELEEFELTWRKATGSYRGYLTKKQQGITGEKVVTHNSPQSTESTERSKFVLKFDFAEE